MDPFRKYTIQQLIKQTGKIPRATTLIDNAVAQLKIRLKDAGQDISKFTDPKQITQFFNKEKSLWNQNIKRAADAAPKNILKTTKKKEKPFTGWTPKVVEKSMRPSDYADLKKEYFRRVMTSTDDSINNFLKKGIDKVDDRFLNLSKTQRKDFLDMVDYRLKHGNKKFMNDFTDAAGKFKFPENLAYGGIAGMLGEPTYEDDNHRVPYGEGKKVTMGVPSDVTTSGLLDINFDELELEEWFDILKSVEAYQDGGPVRQKLGRGYLAGGYKNIKDKYYKDSDLEAIINSPEINSALFGHWGIEELLALMGMGFEKGGRVGFDAGGIGDSNRSKIKRLADTLAKWKYGTPLSKLTDKKRFEMEDLAIKKLGLTLEDLGITKFNQGGRVGLQGGGIPGALLAALKAIMQKYGKDAIKLLKDIKPSKKWDTKKAIQAFKDRNPEFKITSPVGDAPKAGEVLDKRKAELIKKFGNKTATKDEKAELLKIFKAERPQDIEKAEAFGKAWEKANKERLVPPDMTAKGIDDAIAKGNLQKEFPGITDDLVNKILADDNPQRIAEVKATLHEAMKMQQKGMGTEEIIQTFQKTPRTKNASGGRVSLSSGGVAGMLGE